MSWGRETRRWLCDLEKKGSYLSQEIIDQGEGQGGGTLKIKRETIDEGWRDWYSVGAEITEWFSEMIFIREERCQSITQTMAELTKEKGAQGPSYQSLAIIRGVSLEVRQGSITEEIGDGEQVDCSWSRTGAKGWKRCSSISSPINWERNQRCLALSSSLYSRERRSCEEWDRSFSSTAWQSICCYLCTTLWVLKIVKTNWVESSFDSRRKGRDSLSSKAKTRRAYLEEWEVRRWSEEHQRDEAERRRKISVTYRRDRKRECWYCENETRTVEETWRAYWTAATLKIVRRSFEQERSFLCNFTKPSV